jgi:hypothetical protein
MRRSPTRVILASRLNPVHSTPEWYPLSNRLYLVFNASAVCHRLDYVSQTYIDKYIVSTRLFSVTSSVKDAIKTPPRVPEKHIARAVLPGTSSHQLACRLLVIQIIVLFKTRWRVTLFAPFGVRDFLRRHVESDNLHIR